MSVIVDYMDQNRALREVQLAFDEVDRLFFSSFESWIRMIGKGPIYWSKAGRTFEEGASLFWAYQQPVAWKYDW